MTIEQILQDIRSDRVKKVIYDGDFSAEIDDQYALAYAMGSDKMEVLSINAVAHFEEPMAANTRQTMLRSYCELEILLDSLGIDARQYPAYHGPSIQLTNSPDYAPVDCPSARNIIEISKKYKDELIYVLTTGPCSSVVNAYLLDPSIKDNICVIWLAGDVPSAKGTQPFHEWNLYSDIGATKMMFHIDLPLIYLPCEPHGSVDIVMDHTDLAKIEGDSPAAEYFRKDLYYRFAKNEHEYYTLPKVMCDYAAPAVLAIPDAMEYEIIPCPYWTDDHHYAFDFTNRRIILGHKPNSKMIVEDAIKATNALIKKYYP